MHLLVTRPGTEAERTADILRARGHVVTVAPVLKVETIADAGFGAGPYAAIVMTSANAARVIAGHERRAELLRLPVFTVGRHTAEAVRAAGLDDVISADGGAPELVRLIAAKLQGSGASLLYFAAQERSSDLAGALKAYGIAVETVVVYRTVPSPGLAQDLRAVLDDGLDGVLHYSRRSAETLLRLAERAGARDAVLGLAHYCLSEEVARPLRAAGAARVQVGTDPDETALLGLI